MVFFRLRSVPSCVWPALPDSAFSEAWNAYLELERTQWLERAELEERQLEQVRSLLAHCIANVPYYRDALPAAGIRPGAVRTITDFRRLPLLSRRTFQESIYPRPATALPAGTFVTGTSQTSGSSGNPTNLHSTNRTNLWWHAFYLRDLEWANIDPTGTLAAIRYTGASGDSLQKLFHGVTLPYWLLTLEGLIHTGPSHGMDIRQDPRLQLPWLRRIDPDYLLSYPENLETLAALARRDGPLKNLKVIQSISSTLTPQAQAEIERVFGVPVKNTYSCKEMGYLASPCPVGHGFHVHAENVLLEVLDADDQPCQPGQAGRVVVTHLHNFSTPFIRLELGDVATAGADACACGRGLPLLSAIVGKTRPMFDTGDGRLKHSSELAVRIRQVGGHWQSQIIQKAIDHVVVRLCVDATWTDRHADEVKQAVREFFAASVRTDLDFQDRLELPGSGKFQSTICEINPSQ